MKASRTYCPAVDKQSTVATTDKCTQPSVAPSMAAAAVGIPLLTA